MEPILRLRLPARVIIKWKKDSIYEIYGADYQKPGIKPYTWVSIEASESCPTCS